MRRAINVTAARFRTASIKNFGPFESRQPKSGVITGTKTYNIRNKLKYKSGLVAFVDLLFMFLFFISVKMAEAC